MARLLGDEPIMVRGIRIKARGVTGEVTEGISTTRGVPGGPLDHAIARDGFVDHGELTIDLSSVSRGMRSAGEQATADHQAPAVLVEAPQPEPEELGQLVVVEDGEFVYIVRPAASGPEKGWFEIPVGDAVAARRGFGQLIGRVAVRVVGVFARKAVEHGFELAIRAIERQLRQCHLRSLTSADHRGDPERIGGELLRGGPALLLIHDVNTNSSKGFRFDASYLSLLGRRYGGRVAGYDHPSLSFGPRANAEWLANELDGKDVRELDILAHGRGGLVARELLKLLGPSSSVVRSIVFASTPNNGTPLADADRVEAMLGMAANVTAVIPDNPVTDAIGIGLEVLREYMGGVVEAIDGVTCMKPGSDTLRALAKEGRGDTVFRAIATHFEPRSDARPLRRAADYVMDRAFFGEANDLLVPTRSTYLPSDQFHVPVDERLVLSTSFGVSHGSLWSETRVLKQLDEWLDPAKAVDGAAPVEAEHTDPAAEIEEATRVGNSQLVRSAENRLRADMLQHVSRDLGGSFDVAAARSRDTTRKGSAHRGTVVLLPGILGSQLRVSNTEAPADSAGELVWCNPWSLVRGRFRRLAVGDENYRVEPDGLMKQYAALFGRLAGSWDVHAFAYDWRLSIDELRDHLAQFLDARGIDIAAKEPVHFVGHSMGGLVARAYIGAQRDRWNEGQGRLVQLGTPNWGSFAMVAAVLGDELTVRALAAADMVNSKNEILRVFGSFPSVYQLFPSPLRKLPEGGEPGHAALFGADGVWYRTHGDGGELPSVRPELIAAARTFHTDMAKVKGGDRVIFVAGDSQLTPYRARIETSGKVSFGVTRSGDGRVTHDFGYADMDIAEDRTFFLEASHGALANDERVLDAIDELLETGTTTRLGTQPSGIRGRLVDDVAWVDSDELERTLGFAVPSGARDLGLGPNSVDGSLDDATRLYLGGGRKAAAPALRVRVAHGSMEQAKYPVAAGRYKGIPIEGALAYLNTRLDDALRDLQDFDLLPDEAGSAYYLPPLDDGTYPRGAIVVGLGEFGELSATRLARAVERGTIQYALARQTTKHERPTIGVSAVLIGTPGRYGLSVESSILAMVQGVSRAAARVKDTVCINDLEIIELHEGKAEEAAMAIARLWRTDRFEGMEVPINPELRVDVRPGGRPGSGGYEQTGAPWLRLLLDLKKPRSAATGSRRRRLRWVSLGRSSQADRLEVDIPEEEIRRHVRMAIQNPEASGTTNLTLFEMLFPHEAKLDLDEKDNLHLLVDSSTAWIPWEVVTGRDTGGKLLQPLALRAGLLRQLKPDQAVRPRRNFVPIGRRALVIGDPPTSLPRLPGARAEGRAVADLLERNGYEVTRLIYDDDKQLDSGEIAAEIRDAFFAEHYRIVHIAAHGVFEEGSTDRFASGVVIGDLAAGELLTAQHFAQRLVRPDLVFLNCCHIGRIDDPSATLPQQPTAHSHLAASISIELMRTGVRAVVAAGWAVNDAAALRFATSFYSSMFEGYAYGESVSGARKACYDPHNNTWGAYQCYGDPDFQFFGTPRRSTGDFGGALSVPHLVKRINVLAKKAGDQVGRASSARVAAELRDIEDGDAAPFGSPEVWRALGEAYAEAGDFDSAVDCLRKAVDSGSTDMKVSEQLANLEVRLAAMINRCELASARRPDESPADLCRTAEATLTKLRQFKPTDEREVIRGSLYKRWATIGEEGRDRLDDLRTSRDAYYAAARMASEGSAELSVYQACLAVQMAYLAAIEAGRSPRSHVRWFTGYVEQLRRQRENMDPQSVEGDYYTRVRPIDIDATLIIATGQIAEPGNGDRIVDGFTSAFKIRSSAKQRLGVEHHYRELAELLPEGQNSVAKNIANRLGEV